MSYNAPIFTGMLAGIVIGTVTVVALHCFPQKPETRTYEDGFRDGTKARLEDERREKSDYFRGFQDGFMPREDTSLQSYEGKERGA